MPAIIDVYAQNDFVWSENRIPHRIAMTGITTERIIIEIRIGVQTIATLNYPALPDADGFMEIDLQPILKDLVNPVRPLVKSGSTFVSSPTVQNGNFVVGIYTRLSTWAPPGLLATKTLIAGGWDNMDLTLSGSQNNYTVFSVADFFCNTGDQARIISHMPKGRVMDAQETGFLSFAMERATIASQTVTYQAKYLDSIFSWGTVVKSFPVTSKKTTFHIPVGIQQVGLDPLGKGVDYCEITIGNTAEVLAKYRIKYDYRPCYDWLDIHFRNSLGGWDFFRFKGNIVCSTDVDRLEYELKNNSLPTGPNNYFNTQFKLKWKASTGYISMQQMIALNDLIRSKDVCLLIESKYYQLKCTSKSLQWNDSKDGLYSETFEFETAGKFNSIPQQLMQLFSKPPELRS